MRMLLPNRFIFLSVQLMILILIVIPWVNRLILLLWWLVSVILVLFVDLFSERYSFIGLRLIVFAFDILHVLLVFIS